MDFTWTGKALEEEGEAMKLHRNRGIRSLICMAGVVVCASAPLAGQRGVDLVNADEVLRLNSPRVGPVDLTNTVRLVAGTDPESVTGATHETMTYKYDDGEFENFDSTPLGPPHPFEREAAQRFALNRSGELVSVTVCFLRPSNDQTSDVVFDVVFYRDDDGEPGVQDALRYQWESRIRPAGRDACLTFAGAMAGKSLARGAHWVGIRWQSTTNKILGEDRYTEDDPAPEDDDGNVEHATSVRTRSRAEGDDWPDDWVDSRGSALDQLKAYGIRMVVDHSSHAPDPDPDPDPDDPEPDPDPGVITPPPAGGGYSDCRPAVAPLTFEGDVKVSLCYETAKGEVDDASAVYRSGNSGLLYFFGRENAEVFVKVLNGCEHNGHRWVYMAALTDVAFNMYINDGRSPTKAYHNRLGDNHELVQDLMAFPCAQ